MIFFFVLLLLVLIAQIAEFFIPALPWLYNAHVYIVPVIVFYGAMALPFPLMLSLALFAGVLLDALTVQVIGGKVEISAGSSILIYGVFCIHPRSLVADRRAWSHCHGHGPDRILVLTMDRTRYGLFLSTRKGAA